MTNPDAKKLKPCPFCGGGAILLDKGYDGWIAVCDKRCTVHGGKEAAIAAWNRRTNDEP